MFKYITPLNSTIRLQDFVGKVVAMRFIQATDGEIRTNLPDGTVGSQVGYRATLLVFDAKKNVASHIGDVLVLQQVIKSQLDAAGLDNWIVGELVITEGAAYQYLNLVPVKDPSKAVAAFEAVAS